MPIRIVFEFDTPQEAAQLFKQLPVLERVVPQLPAQGKRDLARELSRPSRYDEYLRNGGRRSFLGWAQEGEPPNPTDEIDQTPKN